MDPTADPTLARRKSLLREGRIFRESFLPAWTEPGLPTVGEAGLEADPGTRPFRDLPEDALTLLASNASEVKVSPGPPICTRNEPGDKLYLVLEGTVEVSVPTHASVPAPPEFDRQGRRQSDDALRDRLMKGGGANEAVVRTVQAGEFFGELACLEPDGRRTATVTTPRGCTLLVIPQGAFLQVLQQHPDVTFRLLRHVSGRLRWHMDHLARTVRGVGLVRPSERVALDKANRTWWQWIADGVIWAFAHPVCTIFHAVWWVYWFKNLGANIPFTPWIMDVDLLTNIVSLEAIVLAIAILVAQRRKDDKDESRDNQQFTNTAVSVEQASVILARLATLEAELRHQRLKSEPRDRLRTRPDSDERST